jgi:tetratricopeptide (TPR) repeat protein
MSLLCGAIVTLHLVAIHGLDDKRFGGDKVAGTAPGSHSEARAQSPANDDIEHLLRAAVTDEQRWTLEAARQTQWESGHEHDKALANARRLLADPRTTSDQSEFLLDREAFNLFNLDRVDEGLACYDRQILDAVDEPARRVKLLEAKARMLLSHVEPARAVSAWREYRQAIEPRSGPWKAATATLTLQLARIAEHEEAIALCEELVRSYHDSEPLAVSATMIEIARSQYAMRQGDRALESLEMADKVLRGAPATPRHIAQIDRLQTDIIKLREILRAGE